jgi:hypothetical protein
MQKLLKSVIVALFFSNISTMVSAKVSDGTIMFGDQIDRTHITHLTNLPDIDKFKIDGKFFDLGWAHTRARFFIFPLWGSADGNYVLYVERGYGWEYHNISLKQAEEYAKYANLNLYQLPYVQTYHNFIGTVLFAGLLLIILLTKIIMSCIRYAEPEKPKDKIKARAVSKLNSFEEIAKIRNNTSYYRGKNIK